MFQQLSKMTSEKFNSDSIVIVYMIQNIYVKYLYNNVLIVDNFFNRFRLYCFKTVNFILKTRITQKSTILCLCINVLI